jgi:tryptophan synthase alpha subunit
MEESAKTELKWDLESAEIAYGVIARYVEHTQISGIIIALLASALGEERLKPIAQSEHWLGYMASKRSITEAKQEVERLTALIERMRKEGTKTED